MCALLSLATNNASLQTLIARSNGIPPLIKLVAEGSLQTQEYAASSLWHLAGNSEVGSVIADAGGIVPIIQMLSVDNVHAQELAAVIIARLSRSQPAVVPRTVAAVGGIIPLVRLARIGSATAQQQAAAALAEVSHVSDNRALVAAAEGIAPLVSLLSSTVVGTAEIAARALAHLATNDGQSTPGGAADAGASVSLTADASQAPQKRTARERRASRCSDISEGNEDVSQRGVVDDPDGESSAEGEGLDEGDANEQPTASVFDAFATAEEWREAEQAAERELAGLLAEPLPLGSSTELGGSAPMAPELLAQADEEALAAARRWPGAERRRAIAGAGGINKLVDMLSSGPFDDNSALLMWKLVASVIGFSAEDAEPPKGSNQIDLIGQQEQVWLPHTL